MTDPASLPGLRDPFVPFSAESANSGHIKAGDVTVVCGYGK